MKRRWLVVAASLALLALAIYLLDWVRLREGLGRVSPGPMALAILLTIVIQGVLALRWAMIVGRSATISWPRHLRTYLFASFLNSFTPANLGADVYRVAVLRGSAGGVAPLLAAVVQERLLGLATYFAAYLICLALALTAVPPSGRAIFLMAAVVAAAGLGAIALAPWLLRQLARWRSLARMAGRMLAFGASALDLRAVPAPAGVTLLSAIAWVLWLVAVAVIADDLDLDLSLPLLGAIIALTELLRLLPVSFQGIGVREGSFALLVHSVGGDAALGFLVGAIAYLAVSVTQLLCVPLSWLAGRMELNR
jgi:hypothetical protein